MKKKAPVTQFDQVKEFHLAFGHPVHDEPTAIEIDRAQLRINLILEEVVEYMSATIGDADNAEYMNAAIASVLKAMELVKKAQPYEFENPDLVGIADGLGDIGYVVAGAAHEYGIPLNAVNNEIHGSNMTKLGPEGKPIYNEVGKIMKGPDYRPPNVEEIVFPVPPSSKEAS